MADTKSDSKTAKPDKYADLPPEEAAYQRELDHLKNDVHREAINVMSEESPRGQQEAFLKDGVSPKGIMSHYQDLVKQWLDLDQKTRAAIKKVNLFSAIAYIGTLIATIALSLIPTSKDPALKSRTVFGDNWGTKLFAIFFGPIGVGTLTNIISNRLLTQGIKEESIKVSYMARRALTSEYASAEENVKRDAENAKTAGSNTPPTVTPQDQERLALAMMEEMLQKQDKKANGIPDSTAAQEQAENTGYAARIDRTGTKPAQPSESHAAAELAKSEAAQSAATVRN